MDMKEEIQSLRGLFEGADLNGAQINFITGDHAEVNYQKINSQNEHPHFPLNSTKDEGIRIYNALIDNCFMQGQQDSWLFLMGFVEQKPARITAIKWTGTKEQLRMMLRLLYQRLIDEKNLKVAEIERLTPKCFVDEDGKPMTLAKKKDELSNEIDKLREIIRPNSTSSETL